MKIELGPGIIVAAAFIGPGTVTACTVAGANFGFTLIWALFFATIATIILQDMAARLGAGARLGLGEALIRSAPSIYAKWTIGTLVFVALFIGNCAYQGGNLTGGALGINAMLADEAIHQNYIVGSLAIISGSALLFGQYKMLERLLIGLVILMSIAFIFSFIYVRPDIGLIVNGLIPKIPENGALTAIALIGTTIVPYNLFLHAASVRKKWPSGDPTPARRDSCLSIGLGGLISIFILSIAAASLFESGLNITSAADMAVAIEPAFGGAARHLIGLGLFAAGLTSAISAPMAAAFAVTEMLGDKVQKRQLLFKVTALSIVCVGTAISLLGIKPVSLILVAQYANGLLLPVVACFLLYIMNRRDLLGSHANSWVANIAGVSIVLVTFGLGIRSIMRALGYI